MVVNYASRSVIYDRSNVYSTGHRVKLFPKQNTPAYLLTVLMVLKNVFLKFALGAVIFVNFVVGVVVVVVVVVV
jgi:hypothetical protein